MLDVNNNSSTNLFRHLMAVEQSTTIFDIAYFVDSYSSNSDN